MPDLIPVDHDPFNDAPSSLIPVDHDPFGDAPVAKIGQTIAPPNVMGGISDLRNTIGNFAGDVTGVNDAVRAAQGQMTPEEAQTFALGAAAGVVAPEARGLGELAEEAAPTIAKGIRAFHGSPHDFDRFDLSKIGTGEGAQVYGHGLYFAENPDTAKAYRDVLSSAYPITYKNKELPVWSDDPEIVAAQYYIKAGGDIKNASASIDRLTGSLDRIQALGADIPNQNWEDNKLLLQQARQSLQTLDARDVRFPGHSYEVNIAADPEHFLDWDKPLSEQSEHVQTALAQVLGQGQAYGTGARMYHDVDMVPDEAARQLRKAGVVGIKYLDQGSRGAENGTHNFVVFDDKLIDIIKKYGLAGLIAGGAAHFSTTPVDHDPFVEQM